jgi:uncharacterized delta-60 repeat protein
MPEPGHENPSGMFVARFTPSGALDPTFGNGGYLEVMNSTVNGVALDASGNIVIVGMGAFYGPISSGGVGRLTPSGALDPTFGTGGVVQFPVSTGFPEEVFAVAIQPGTGSLILAGNAWKEFGDSILRLNPDGSLDTTFNGTGTLYYEFPNDGSNGDIAAAVAVSPTGDIAMAGWGYDQWDVLYVQPDASPTTYRPANAPPQATTSNAAYAPLAFDSPDFWDALHPLTKHRGAH